MKSENKLNLLVLVVAFMAFLLPNLVFFAIAGVTLIFFLLIQKEYFLQDDSGREARWSIITLLILLPLIAISNPPVSLSFLFLFLYLGIRLLIMKKYSLEQSQQTVSIDSGNDVEDSNQINYLLDHTIDNFSENMHHLQAETGESEDDQEDYSEFVNMIKAEVINDVQSDIASTASNSAQREKEVNDKLDKLNDSLSAVNEALAKTTNENTDDKEIKTELKNSLDEIVEQVKQVKKEKNNVDSIADILIDKLRDEKLDFSNTRHIQNTEIRDLFIQAFKEAQEEIDIISPWISKWVLEDQTFKKYIEKALKRGVTVKIIYGIEDNTNRRDDSSDFYASGLVNSFRKYGKLFRMKKGNTHYKLLICDDKYYVAGSFNFLSFRGDYSDPNTRHEGAEYSENLEQITFKRKMYFDF